MIVTRRVEIKLKPPPKHKHPHLDIVASGSLAELYGTRVFDAKNKNEFIQPSAPLGNRPKPDARGFARRFIFKHLHR